MKIGIIDADLLGRKKHRFPNLACMKISGYHKEKGDEDSPFRGMYINLHRWCNQPNQFKKKTFREFSYDKINTAATRRYADEFEKKYPKIAAKYYDLKYWDLKEY